MFFDLSHVHYICLSVLFCFLYVYKFTFSTDLSSSALFQGCMNNVTFGDEKIGYYETVAGGAGAVSTL